MAKEFKYRGKTLEELQQLDVKEFARLIPARERRTLLRGFTPAQQALLKRVKENPREIKTHCRSMVILPSFVGKNFKIHQGKEFALVQITEDMLGHRLGEFALTRKPVKHSAPGIGATRSSAALSVR